MADVGIMEDDAGMVVADMADMAVGVVTREVTEEVTEEVGPGMAAVVTEATHKGAGMEDTHRGVDTGVIPAEDSAGVKVSHNHKPLPVLRVIMPTWVSDPSMPDSRRPLPQPLLKLAGVDSAGSKLHRVLSDPHSQITSSGNI